MKNIAITGRMAAGKTTISDRLVQQHELTRVSFAGRLKEVASSVYGGGLTIPKGATFPMTERGGLHFEVTGRELLQRLGQVVKDMDRDFWVKWLDADLQMGRYGAGPFVLDDMRFQFEADHLRRMGWLLVRVEVDDEVRRERYNRLYGRYPTAAEENHESEREVSRIKVDLVVPGDGDVDETVLDILDVASGWCAPHMKVS